MMHMWFWFDTDIGSFLFSGYDVSTLWGFFATCLGILSLAVLYEAMKVLQIKLHKKTVSSLAPGAFGGSENSSLLTQIASEATETSKANWYLDSAQPWRGAMRENKWTNWILEVLHWSAHTTLGYMLMLAVMTYNAYIGISLVIGASLGYWIFGMTLIEMNLSQFRESRDKIVRCDPECADAVENSERRASTISIIADQLMAEVSAEIHVPIAS